MVVSNTGGRSVRKKTNLVRRLGTITLRMHPDHIFQKTVGYLSAGQTDKSMLANFQTRSRWFYQKKGNSKTTVKDIWLSFAFRLKSTMLFLVHEP